MTRSPQIRPRPPRSNARRSLGLSRHRVGLFACMIGACGPRPSPPTSANRADRLAIVAAERGPNGVRLVSIDEHGDRLFEILQPASALARDTNPAISPDCQWVVFASSRERSLDTMSLTRLWIARLAPEAVPVRITGDDAHDRTIDSHPAWTRDGRAIVFASTRAGDFDLYRQAIERGRPVGEPERLTTSASHEVTPVVAHDGSIIYAETTLLPDQQVESHLEVRAPDGSITRLTEGPADTSPALSPDEQTIAFARPMIHAAGADADLWTVPRAGGAAVQLVDVPLTDESGPVWSPDGRFVFATSALRGASGKSVLFSSVIHVDLTEHPRVARILEDRTGPIVRLTPALACTPLDAVTLRSDPEYLPAIARIVARAIAEQKAQTEPHP